MNASIASQQFVGPMWGLIPQFKDIPPEIRQGYWCVWKANPRKGRPGKFDKIPYGHEWKISTAKPQEWLTYDEAITKFGMGGFDGVGKLVMPNEGLVYVDIDDISEADAVTWASNYPTYAEWSPSKKGVHFISKGTVSRDVTKPHEVYSGHAARFLSVTGNIVKQCHSEVADVTTLIESQIISLSPPGADIKLDKDIPSLLSPEETTKFGEVHILNLPGERSEELQAKTVALFRKGLSEQEVISVLVNSTDTINLALEHRQDNWGRAVEYLWKGTQKSSAYIERNGEVRRDPAEVFAGIPLYGSTDQIPCESFPDKKTNNKGEVTGLKATNENLTFLIDGFGITTSYDVHSKEAKFSIPGLKKTAYGKSDVAIGEIISKAVRCGLPKQELQKTILDLAYKNPDFPVRDYLSSLKWDGVDHITKLCETLHVPEESEHARNISILLWLIQCAAAADGGEQTPNKLALARFEYVLVLGGKQGLNKTKWFRGLVPKPLQNYFKDGLSLDPTNRDSIKKATRFWVVELGEIDATFKHDKIAQLKAFLSETDDVYRVSYGRTENSYPRMTSFCGSVNEMRFLKDATGNRRYWPTTPHAITLPQNAGIDVTQVWAQAWHLYLSGVQWWPTDTQESVIQATRNAVEQDHETAVGERLFEYFGECSAERKALSGSRQMRPLEIARAIGILKPDKRDYTDMRNWLERNNLDEHGRPDSISHANQNSWLMPPRCSTVPPLVMPDFLK